MALKATIFKATLHISDVDRQLYESFPLIIARHPSETDIRMMVRLVAFAFNASDKLIFTKGLSTDDEPDLWQKNLSGEIESWIELGLPSEDRLRKACNRSHQVWVYAYGTERNMTQWWSKISNKLARFENLRIYFLPEAVTQMLPSFVKSSMNLQCTIQDGELWLSDETNSLQIIAHLEN